MPPQFETREATDGRPAVRAALRSLADGAMLIERLSDEQYTRPMAPLRGATIGQHVRHALDHFAAILLAPGGEPIFYDRRRRGTAVESSRLDAIEHIARLTETLERIGADRSHACVTVVAMLNPDEPETSLESTLSRELVFATHHALHHHAMLLLAAEELGVELPTHFGRAPATILHERSND